MVSSYQVIRSLLSLDHSDPCRKLCCRKCKITFEKRQKNFEIVEQLEAEIIELTKQRKRCCKQLFDHCESARECTTTSTPKRTSSLPGTIQECPISPVPRCKLQ